MDPRTLREKNPDMPCAPRSFRCPDGVTRVVTYDRVYWDTLDYLVREGIRTEEKIIAISWKAAQADKANGKDPESVFPAYLAITIYEYYHWYLQDRDGLSNDNNEPWVRHSRAEWSYPEVLYFPRVTCELAFLPTVTRLSAIRKHLPAYRS